MPVYLEHIREDLDPTAGEGELIDGANTAHTDEMNQTRIISALYAKKAIEKLIKSNEKLAKSNERYALALNILTLFLVIATFLLVFATYNLATLR